MSATRRFAAFIVLLLPSVALSAQDLTTQAETPPVQVSIAGTVDVTTFAAFQPEHRIAPRGVLDLTATADLARLVHWPGATLVAQYYAFGGRNGSRIMGDYEGFSAIDADPFARVGELSLDVQWLSERVRTRIGRLDANSDFALPMSTELFQHSSAGFSGAIFPMPTYPNPELGAIAEFQVGHGITATGGMYAGPEPADVPDLMVGPGRMWIGQVAAGRDAEAGRIVAGAWRHTGRFLTDDGTESASAGWFMLGERVAGRVATGREVVASVQLSVSATEVAPVRQHVAFGVRLRRLTHRRERDAMGIRVSFAELSGGVRQEHAPDERVLEVFHRFSLNDWLALQPDLQVIRLPAGAVNRDRIAFTLRLQVER